MAIVIKAASFLPLVLAGSVAAASPSGLMRLGSLHRAIVPLQSRTGYITYINMPWLVLDLFPASGCGGHRVLSSESFMQRYRVAQDLTSNLHDSQGRNVAIHVNLCGSTIRQIKSLSITGISLSDADFERSEIRNIKISDVLVAGASFDNADMRRASLVNLNGARRQYYSNGKKFATDYVSFSEALLTNARLLGGNLKGAFFVDAVMRNAVLKDVNLTDADFSGADLTGATIDNADLSGAQFHGANLLGVIYEPQGGKLPDLAAIAGARNLDRLTYHVAPTRLLELGSALYKAGFDHAARAVTAAIQATKNRTKRLSPSFSTRLQGYAEYLFLQLPTEWGYRPFRALFLVCVLMVFFWPIYVMALVGSGDSTGAHFFLTETQRSGQGRTVALKLDGILRPLVWGLYVSVLSAFNIGWQGVDMRGWIRKLQPRPYSIEPVGWPRVVSGVQSLVSLYLIVIFFFTYLGRPFMT